MTTPQARMLTAQELLQLRAKVDKTLPTRGTKEFKPSHSWLENKQIQTALDERKALLEEERVEKLGSLAKAEWDSEKKVANVTLKVGHHWKQMGHDVGGKLILFPEEALFLLETNSLELTHNGVAMSIQQAYCTLLGPETGCTLNEYLTYLHLVRQGYTLLRHSKSIRATRYERQIRLDQHTVGQKQRKFKEDVPVQEIVIDDGNTDVKKSHTQNINNTSKSENAVRSGNSEIVNIKLSDVDEESVPNSVNKNLRINGEPEICKRQKRVENSQSGERSYMNGIITNEHSNLKTETSKDYSGNHTTVSDECLKVQPSSICNNIDKSSSTLLHNVVSTSKTSEEITVIQCDKITSLEVLHSENIESERTNSKGMESVLVSDMVAVTSVVDVENTAGDSNKTKNDSVHHDNKIISSNEETDIIVVDDSSASMDTSEKQVEGEQKTKCIIGQSDKQKEPNIMLNVTQKPAVIVEICDNSQTSQQEVVDKRNSLSNCNDEIEIVNLIDDKKKDIDDIIEVKYNMSAKSEFSVKSKENNIEVSALKNETQTSSQKNLFTLKGGKEESMKNNIGQNKKKITNIQLKHDEVEIMPNIINLSEDEDKEDVKDEIEVVDLDDDDRLNNMWEKERMKILDSIPNIEGKYVMHVKVPDESLLPPNVCPQKQDYYIHRWNVHEADLGGRPSSDASHSRRNDVHNNSMETEETLNPWSPWVQFPSSPLQGGGNVYGATEMWNDNNNAFPFLNTFMNSHFQPSFFEAFAMQSMFPRDSSMYQNFGGPSWRPSVPFIPHRSRNSYVSRSWYYHRRPYYRRPYYKRRRRYESQYNNTCMGLGEQNFGNRSSCNEIIPLKVEDEKPTVKVQVIDDDEVVDDHNGDEDEKYDIDIDDDSNDENQSIEDDDDEEEEDDDDDDDDVIECTSDFSPFKIENDIVECTVTENQIDKGSQNGVERFCKRRGTQSQRVFEPPKKLRGIIDKLKVEPKQRKNKTGSQESKGKENASENAKTWKDVKQIVILDSGSEEEEYDDDEEVDDDEDSEDDDIFVIVDDVHRIDKKKNETLIQPEDCSDVDSILSKLQIIKPFNFEKTREIASDKNLKISFDLYMPSATFRKARPGLPNYRITIFGYEEPLPEPGEVIALLKDFQDDVPLLFAIVLPDTVTFLQCGSIQLPVDSFCP